MSHCYNLLIDTGDSLLTQWHLLSQKLSLRDFVRGVGAHLVFLFDNRQPSTFKWCSWNWERSTRSKRRSRLTFSSRQDGANQDWTAARWPRILWAFTAVVVIFHWVRSLEEKVQVQS